MKKLILALVLFLIATSAFAALKMLQDAGIKKGAPGIPPKHQTYQPNSRCPADACPNGSCPR